MHIKITCYSHKTMHINKTVFFSLEKSLDIFLLIADSLQISAECNNLMWLGGWHQITPVCFNGDLHHVCIVGFSVSDVIFDNTTQIFFGLWVTRSCRAINSIDSGKLVHVETCTSFHMYMSCPRLALKKKKIVQTPLLFKRFFFI